jgi:hypothetical protein
VSLFFELIGITAPYLAYLILSYVVMLYLTMDSISAIEGAV